jgi:hypothetical protein
MTVAHRRMPMWKVRGRPPRAEIHAVLSPVSKVDWLSLADACTASDDDIGREGLHSEDELRWGGARRRGGVRACGIDEVR